MATATRPPPQEPKAPGAKGKQFAEQRRAEADALRARFDGFESDPDNAALLAMALATFDGYSDRNAGLIAMQCPTATDVSGYRQWIARGRRVARGEAGIRILAPAGTYRVKDESDPDGEGTERQAFRMVTVFDVAQTLTLAEWEAAEAARLAAQGPYDVDAADEADLAPGALELVA